MILAVCLSVSVAHASSLGSNDQSVIDDLVYQSGVISNQIRIGTNFVGNAAQVAGQGQLIDQGAYRQALITDQMQNAYNASMSDFVGHNFYSAQDHLNEMAEVASQNLEASIDNFVEAASVIEVVSRINQQASQVSNTVEAEAVQAYAVSQGADNGITDQQQNNYNEAVAEVSSAAREFATYKAASVDANIIESMNYFEDSYGADLNYAQTQILPNGYMQTAYLTAGGAHMATITHTNYFMPVYQGDSLYEDNGYGLGD